MSGAGACAPADGTPQPDPLDPRPSTGRSFSSEDTAMKTATTEIATDLITPLGAYLRLRGEGAAAFLLESVEHGRLGRFSLVGHGSRLLDLEEAKRLGEPVVGYVGY